MDIGTYLLNCFLLLLPIFIWNMIFANKLPEKYTDKGNWDNIPKLLAAAENTLRTIVFLLPVVMKLSFSGTQAIIGLVIYLIGMIVYFASWTIQIKFPEHSWSMSLLGTMAPAYTTLPIFIGIGLIGKESFLNIPNISLFYIILSIVFVAVHSIHAYLAYTQFNKRVK
jgi:hypothetical protein